MKLSVSPQVSVLLPFYNAATTLQETLDTIAAQTLEHFEVLAVDDGSGDEGPALVERMRRKDPRFRLLRPGRVGFVAALNHGLKAARSDRVARMDADDRMHPLRLARQNAFLDDHPDIDLLGTRTRLFPEEHLQAGMKEYVRWQNTCLSPDALAADIYVESPIAHPTMMFRRDVVLRLGGYREGPFPEDYELLLRLHHAGRRMAKLDEVLLEWRDGPDRMSRTDSRCSREAFDRLRAAYLHCDPRLRTGRPLVFWGAGRKTRRRTDHLIARGHRPAAWVDIDSKKIGNRVDGAEVVPPEWLAGRHPRPFVLNYVANHGARELIGSQLDAMGYRKGHDYLMVG